MNPTFRLQQPSLTRLSRTGLLFLGSIALSSHAQQTPATNPPPGTAPPVRQDPTQQPTATSTPIPSVPPTVPPTSDSKVDQPGYHRQDSAAHDDRDFVVQVEAGLRREAANSELAAQRAKRGEVRGFAQTVVDTQREIGRELTALATKKKIKLATTAAGHRPPQTQLDPAAANFEQAYLQLMVQDHERAVRLFTDAAQHSEDDDVRAFAGKFLPALREQLEQAQQMQGAPRR